MPLKPPHAAIRFDGTITVGDAIVLDRDAVRSLSFREVNVKEAFTLKDTNGAYFRASLLAKAVDRAEATVYEALPSSPESNVEITLVCAVLARQRMLLVAQKATELGVTRIVPVFSAKSVGPEGLNHEKAHAWPGQTIRAARQCRRATIPELGRAAPLREALDHASWKGADLRFVLDDRIPDAGPLPAASSPKSLALAVGPEGGWTPEETALLKERGALQLRLGTRVLRAETAVIVGLAVLQHAFGDFRSEA